MGQVVINFPLSLHGFIFLLLLLLLVVFLLFSVKMIFDHDDTEVAFTLGTLGRIFYLILLPLPQNAQQKKLKLGEIILSICLASKTLSYIWRPLRSFLSFNLIVKGIYYPPYSLAALVT